VKSSLSISIPPRYAVLWYSAAVLEHLSSPTHNRGTRPPLHAAESSFRLSLPMASRGGFATCEEGSHARSARREAMCRIDLQHTFRLCPVAYMHLRRKYRNSFSNSVPSSAFFLAGSCIFPALTLPVGTMYAVGTACVPVAERRLSASCAPNFKLYASRRIGDGSRCEKANEEQSVFQGSLSMAV